MTMENLENRLLDIHNIAATRAATDAATDAAT